MGLSYNKFRNRKTEVNGIKFDSKKEATEYVKLKHDLDTGKIKTLRLQVPFKLLPKQSDTITGKLIERAVVYKADFVVKELNNSETIIDVKGIRTQLYILKRKLMLFVYDIKIKEI